MTRSFRSIARRRAASQPGFSVLELLVSMGLMSIIMGGTMMALANATKANQSAVLITGMNNSLRTGMDLMVRDLLQVGSGLPVGHFILIPSGASEQINLPGPPGTAFKSVVGDVDINAVNPGNGWGPLVNIAGNTACTVEGPSCVKTDTITTLAADNTFTDVRLVARSANGKTITVEPTKVISSGPDRVIPGQLIMLERTGFAILLEVTDVQDKTITFETNDSLNLNVHSAANGSTTALTALGPGTDQLPAAGETYLATVATRVRMVTYYIDATDPAHPKLVRRINNGHPTAFDNTSGNVVALDIDNLQIAYDIADGVTNPANQDCSLGACSLNSIRKVNVTLWARSRLVFSGTRKYFRNSLTTQVSLRGMAFVNEYAPQ